MDQISMTYVAAEWKSAMREIKKRYRRSAVKVQIEESFVGRGLDGQWYLKIHYRHPLVATPTQADTYTVAL